MTQDRRPVTVITGASSGIGEALAPMLAERGAVVGVVARRADRLEATLARCQAHTPGSRLWVIVSFTEGLDTSIRSG